MSGRRDEKIGLGLKHFMVALHERQTRCFTIVRLDGSQDDFSYVKVGMSSIMT